MPGRELMARGAGHSPVKIAFNNDIVYEYANCNPLATGGAEKSQWLLACALAGMGWSVVVGVRKYLAPEQEEIIRGVRFVGMPRGNVVLAWSRFLTVERPD